MAGAAESRTHEAKNGASASANGLYEDDDLPACD
jgi:hypothetical protein